MLIIVFTAVFLLLEDINFLIVCFTFETFIFLRNIPSVDEAWKLPIPAELTTRTIRNAQVKLPIILIFLLMLIIIIIIIIINNNNNNNKLLLLLLLLLSLLSVFAGVLFVHQLGLHLGHQSLKSIKVFQPGIVL